MTTTEKVRPSKWFYGLAALVILAGVSVFVYYVVHGVMHVTDGLTQVVVPGAKDLTLKASLKYTIFLEDQSEVNGKIYSAKTNLDGLTCQIVSLTSGKKINMKRPWGNTTYNIGSRSGRSVLEFMSEEAGTYHFSCGYSQAREGEQVVLAVGSGVTEAILGTILKALAALFGGGMLGGIIFVVVSVMRDRANRRVAQNAAPPVGSLHS